MRREERHHSEAQIRDSIMYGLELVEELEPPSDLRELVFAKAVDMHSAKQIFFEQIQPAGVLLQ